MNPEKIILFDEVCPLCRVYTGVFQRCGWLEADGRQGFAEGVQQWRPQLDLERARHEIPLIDRDGGPTLYGLDALLYLIRQRYPRLARVADIPVIRKPLGWLYRFISYNRRVIAGSTGCLLPEEGAPAFHLGWRLCWLVLAVLSVGTGITVVASTAAPEVMGLAGGWLTLAILFAAAFVRTWDGWGRWAGHAALGTLLWNLAGLMPAGLPWWIAAAATLFLLTWDARHRCGCITILK